MTPKPYTLCGQCYDKEEVDRYIADLEEQHRKRLREVESSWVATSKGREERAVRFTAEQFRDKLKAKDDEIAALKAKVGMQDKEIAFMHQNCKWDVGEGCSHLHGELMACTSDLAEKDRRIADLESQLEAANKQVENLMNSASRIMTMQDSVTDGKCRDLLRQKYLRCLAMEKWCRMCHRELLTRDCLPTKQNWNRHDEWRYFMNYWGRNERRWRDLAERLKERL